MRPHFETVIENLYLLERLSEFHPVVIGTPPLGIATCDSDIDVACTASDLERFSQFVEEAYGHLDEFSARYYELRGEPTVLTSFDSENWSVELFCQSVSTEDQWGFRHFRVEQRILALQPDLRTEIRRLKERGLKTEPAFAEVLGLSGEPYRSVLELETYTDDALQKLLERRLSK